MARGEQAGHPSSLSFCESLTFEALRAVSTWGHVAVGPTQTWARMVLSLCVSEGPWKAGSFIATENIYIRGGGGSRNGLDNSKWMAWDIITHDFDLDFERFLSLSLKLLHEPVVLHLGWGCPRRWLATSRAIFLCHSEGRGHLVDRGQGCCQTSYNSRDLPHGKESPVLKCQQCQGWEKQTQAARNGSLEKVSATCNKHVKLLHMENTHQASSIHSFNRHCLRVTSTSGPVLGTEDAAMSQTRKVSAQHGVSHQWQMHSKTVSATKNSRLQTDAPCTSTLRSLLGLPRGFSAAKAAGKRK